MDPNWNSGGIRHCRRKQRRRLLIRPELEKLFFCLQCFSFLLIELEDEKLFFFISRHFFFKPKLKICLLFRNYSLTVLHSGLSGESAQLIPEDRQNTACCGFVFFFFPTDCAIRDNLSIYYFAELLRGVTSRRRAVTSSSSNSLALVAWRAVQSLSPCVYFERETSPV